MAIVDLANLPNRTFGTGTASDIVGNEQIILNNEGIASDVTIDTLSDKFEADVLQTLDNANGSSLIGYQPVDAPTITVENALQAHDLALENILDTVIANSNLDLAALPTAIIPISDADLILVRQGSTNKKLTVDNVRSEFATDAIIAEQGAIAAQLAAEVARDAAQLSASIYNNIAEGIAATALGSFFSTISPDNKDYLILYKHSPVGTFVYNKVACARDIGLIIKSLSQDLLFSGNSQSTFSGLQYWSQGISIIPGEVSVTISAISYVRDLAIKVITNDTSGVRYQDNIPQFTTGISGTSAEVQILSDEFALILNILTNGTVGVTDTIVSNSLVSSSNTNVQTAFALLSYNKAYIQAEVIAFVDATKPSGFIYDKTKCSRDVGYITDSVSFDLLYGGNKQAIQSGVYYFGFSSSNSAVPTEKPQVNLAYEHIKVLVSYIITSTAVPILYQSSITQTFSGNVGTITEVDNVKAGVDYILNIINNGPTGAGTLTPISLTSSTVPSVIYSATILDDNIEFIKAEVIAYIDSISGAEEISRYPSVAGIEYSIANVIHIKGNGSDLNDGFSWRNAVRTIEKALELAWANNAPTLIEWAPDHVVYSNGHLDMPDDCVIKATHRTVFIRPNPGFEERNVFRMGSGCFIEGIMFEGWRLDSITNPTEGFAVSFRPGAVIRRVPYAHKIAVRSIPTWGVIAPPLDRANANPDVPRGGGVALADGLVCSPNSIFPNIMTWGATPVTPNGIGYCAKNGGLVNGVNAVSMWAHIHFQALTGGQIILSSCSTQFGDYSMQAKGYRYIVFATETTYPLSIQTDAEIAILAAEQQIIDDMWYALIFYGYATDWTPTEEALTRRDSSTFLQCLRWALKSKNQQPMLDFAKGLFNTIGESVISVDKMPAVIFSFNQFRTLIKALPGVNTASDAIVDALIDALINTIQNPVRRKEPSRITAVGHTWSAVMSGVALTKIPPARNGTTILDSILEQDEGVVIASGQDDQGNALFVGGLQINADTGELGGPPFDQAVRRVAIRAAISRSF